MNTHEKTGNAGTFPVIFLIIKISARNTSVNKQSNYKYMNFWKVIIYYFALFLKQ